MPTSSQEGYRKPTHEELLEGAKGRLEDTLASAGDMYVNPETVALVARARDLEEARNAYPGEAASVIVINGKEHLLASTAPPSALETAKAFSDAAAALHLPQTSHNRN